MNLDQVAQFFKDKFGAEGPPPAGGGFGFDPRREGVMAEPEEEISEGFIGAFSPSGGFVGGGIFETPIANLSLSQIIDKFNVTASQAANISAIAKDDFDDFDFGTNTGQGIGSVLQNIPALSGLGGNVSDPQFEGLSAQEIANFLTGGNISNF